jgi:hypothetical protein
MHETTLKFAIDIGDVLDVDFSFDGDIVSLQGYGKRHILCFPDRTVELPATWQAPTYPHLRAISPNRWLLVDTHVDISGDNAFVIDDRGNLISRFHVGAGVLDVCETAGMMAFGYHIDAAYEFGFAADPLAALGVAVFDQNGRIIACLNHDLEKIGLRAENIQCMVARESGELLIVADTLVGPDIEMQSPLIFYDWRMGHVRWEQNDLAQPIAVSAKGKDLFIYSPSDSEENLIRTDVTGRLHRSLGFHKNIFRGLKNGRFLAQSSPIEYVVLETSKMEIQVPTAPAAPLILRKP